MILFLETVLIVDLQCFPTLKRWFLWKLWMNYLDMLID